MLYASVHVLSCFFFNDTATTEIYPLSLHDALPIYTEGEAALDYGVFITPPSKPVFRLMSTYNRRLAAMARKRRERGVFGRFNDRPRFMFGGFTFERNGMNGKHLLKAFFQWIKLELSEGWRSWSSKPVPLP